VARPFDRGIVGSIFAAAYPLIRAREGDNGGWVSVRSASHPDTLTGTVRADHAGEVGHNLSFLRPLDRLLGRSFRHLDFFATLAANRGAIPHLD